MFQPTSPTYSAPVEARSDILNGSRNPYAYMRLAQEPGVPELYRGLVDTPVPSGLMWRIFPYGVASVLVVPMSCASSDSKLPRGAVSPIARKIVPSGAVTIAPPACAS